MIKKSKAKPKTKKEEVRVSGKNLVATLRRLVAEGNARHIIVKNLKGRVLFEFPLTAGVVGTVLLPVFAGIGAIAAMIGECTISVERTDK
jgi:hypothetical protein